MRQISPPHPPASTWQWVPQWQQGAGKGLKPCCRYHPTGASSAKAGQAPTDAASPTPQGLAVCGDTLWQSSIRVVWGANMKGMGDPSLALPLTRRALPQRSKPPAGAVGRWLDGGIAQAHLCDTAPGFSTLQGWMHGPRDGWRVLVPTWNEQDMEQPQQLLLPHLCLPGVCIVRALFTEMEDGCCLHYKVSNEAAGVEGIWRR